MSSARGLGDLPHPVQTNCETQQQTSAQKPSWRCFLSSAPRQNATHGQVPATSWRRRDAGQKAGSKSLENGGLLFLLLLASWGWAGKEASLASPVLAEPCRQAGRWVLCCPSPCCSRQLPSLPTSRTPSAHQIGTACVPSKGGRPNPAIGGKRVARARLHSAGCRAVEVRESLTTVF